MPLNPKQQRFADEYLIDLNATQAAIRAGYSKKTANRIASENLSKLDIQNYIQQKQEKLKDRGNVTLAMVIEGYRRMAFSDVRKFYDANGNFLPVQDLDDETAYALSSFEAYEEKRLEGDGEEKTTIKNFTRKIKMSDKARGLDGLSKILGYYAPDKVANVTSDGKDIIPQKALSDKQFSKLINAINEAATR